MNEKTLLERLYERAEFRAFMRAVRVAVAAGVSALIGQLIKDPSTPLWLTPILMAIDKYLRDKKIY